MIEIEVGERRLMFSCTNIGASGLVIKIAPFPMSDSSESPYLFVAITLAKMLAPQVK